mmetsp:Transcript_2977/g.6416  ORF Transcript_2977/g.6416 Transcript_2977/m.6416 type:complete len:700 (+) Transcript_2977:284-2383(+)
MFFAAESLVQLRPSLPMRLQCVMTPLLLLSVSIFAQPTAAFVLQRRQQLHSPQLHSPLHRPLSPLRPTQAASSHYLPFDSSPRPPPSSPSTTATSLHALSKRRVAILDGAELCSIETYLAEEGSDDDGNSNAELPPRSGGMSVPRLGYLSVVAGTTTSAGVSAGGSGGQSTESNERRVVGVELPRGTQETATDNTISLGNNINLYPNSVATIPPGVSYDDAISTMIASLSGVHCAVPTLEEVGGAAASTAGEGEEKGDEGESNNGVFVGGKVVVLGGGEYATFVADAMACLGVDEVYLITNRGGGSRPKQLRSDKVKVMGPAVGSDEIGFAQSIGTFDSIVDTLSEEVPSVITELYNRHQCDRYVSTYSQSQKIIRDKGILFGRDVARKYVVDAVTKSLLMSSGSGGSGGSGSSNNSKSRSNCIIPPKGFGPNTVQKLLDGGVLYKAKQGGGGWNKNNEDVYVREWSLKDFWEYTSWPRDSDGGGDTRYGLPVLETDDVDVDDEYDMVYSMSKADDEGSSGGGGGGGYEDSLPTLRTRAGTGAGAPPNPYVLEVRGVEGLNSNIVAPGRHAVVFCSATWCRTCRSLKPKYTKIAREALSSSSSSGNSGGAVDDDDDDGDGGEEEKITYAEADTTGTMGKLLSNYLDVEAVPAFVLFRSGKVYGEPLSISRLPSKKLDLAVEMLISGKDFDRKALAELEQ